MLRDGSTTHDATDHDLTWTSTAANGRAPKPNPSAERDALHRQLCATATDEASAIARQVRLLPEAVRLQLWNHFGHVHLLEYLERALSLSPRAALERLRVGKALGQLPQLAAEFDAGRRHYSVVRELTRVATRGTEGSWLENTAGKSLREVENMVSGRKPGDLPGDRPDPEHVMRVVRWEVSATVFAQLRQTRAALEAEHGARMTESEFLEALCRRANDGGGSRSSRPPYQISITECASCGRATQDAAGVEVPIDEATVERANCDHEYLGRVDGEAKTKVSSSTPPALRRRVLSRDHHRCIVPGCRAARHIEVHHLFARAKGGKHIASNLACLCTGHHQRLHAGLLVITGTAPNKLEFRFARGVVAARPPEPQERGAGHTAEAGAKAAYPRVHTPGGTRTVVETEARLSLTGLGFSQAVARVAVVAASERLHALHTPGGTEEPAPLETLIREALREVKALATRTSPGHR